MRKLQSTRTDTNSSERNRTNPKALDGGWIVGTLKEGSRAGFEDAGATPAASSSFLLKKHSGSFNFFLGRQSALGQVLLIPSSLLEERVALRLLTGCYRRLTASNPPSFILISALASLALSGCATTAPSRTAQVTSPPTAARRIASSPIHTVVVDAGHGGHDPGAMRYGLREKDMALDIAKRLSSELERSGLSVVMTRDQDKFVELSGRPEVANQLPADLFVSVHINANRNRQVSGAEVYYPRESVIDSSLTWPPSVRPAEVAMPTWTIKRILWDLALTRSRRHSVKMASHICHSMRDRLGVRCRGVHGARFVVLREATMPAVLVEVGYISNRTEAEKMATPAYRQAIAQAIADGVVGYIQSLGAQDIHYNQAGEPRPDAASALGPEPPPAAHDPDVSQGS